MATFLRMFALGAIPVVATLAIEATPVSAGGGCRGEALTSATGSHVAMTGHSCFVPTVLYVEPGTEVTWTNESEIVHDVAGAPSGWGDYEQVRTGDSVAYSFEQPGTFPYHCFLHPGMVGVIVVGDGRAANTTTQPAVTAATAARESVAAREVPNERPAPVTAAVTAPASEGDGNALLFAGLGVLIGAVAVSLAMAARGMRAKS